MSLTQNPLAVTEDNAGVPQEFALGQNYPNPFNPTTVVSYQLSVVSDVKLTVYNLLGEKVAILVDARQSAGKYQIQWNGRDQTGRQVRAIDGDQGTVAAVAVDVYGAGEHSFASPGLAVQEHRGIGAGRAHHQVVDGAHLRRGADDVVEAATDRHAARAVGAAQRGVLEGARDLCRQGAHVVLVSLVEGALLAVEDLQQKHGFLILRGNEIITDQGDMLVFGLDADIQGVVKLGDLREEVTRAGGFIIVPHPFRGFLTFGVGEVGLTPEKAMERSLFKLVDAVEVLNGKVTEKENDFASRVAAGLGLPVTGGSDAHEISEVGGYATRFPEAIKSERDLIDALKKGGYGPVVFREERFLR